MATAASSSTRWRDAWVPHSDTVYLNAAGQAPMPRASLEAVQASLEWKKFPFLMTDGIERDIPNRVRASLARIIGAKAQEIALTTGASAGMNTLALSLNWSRSDEVLTAQREFPVQYTTWRPMHAREGVELKLVSPRGRWIAAEDFIEAMTARTRLVSVSMVRFDDGSMLDTVKLGEACRERGVVLALDVSQACGGIPIDIAKLGADFITCSGYKWLLGPYGTGFFWGSEKFIASLRPGPYYWQRIDGLQHYDDLIFENPKVAQGAVGLDASETASYFNLSGWDVSLRLLLEIGVETVAEHNRKLAARLIAGLPEGRCEVTSPLEMERRGPYVCFAARNLDETRELYQRMRKEKLIASLREGNIRVSTHLYNTEEEIDRVLEVIQR